MDLKMKRLFLPQGRVARSGTLSTAVSRFCQFILFLVVFSILPSASQMLRAADVPGLRNLIENGSFRQIDASTGLPVGFSLGGSAAYGELGKSESEIVDRGVRFSATSTQGNGEASATLSTTVRNLTPADGRWFRLRIRGLALDDFKVADQDLNLQVEFFRDGGKSSLDHVKKSIYALIEQDRKALADKGTNAKLGRAVWRSFDLDFHTPFPEVDTLILSVVLGHGQGPGSQSQFLMSEMQLTPIPVPDDYVQPKGGKISRAKRPGPRWCRWAADGISTRGAASARRRSSIIPTSTGCII